MVVARFVSLQSMISRLVRLHRSEWQARCFSTARCLMRTSVALAGRVGPLLAVDTASAILASAELIIYGRSVRLCFNKTWIGVCKGASKE